MLSCASTCKRTGSCDQQRLSQAAAPQQPSAPCWLALPFVCFRAADPLQPGSGSSSGGSLHFSELPSLLLVGPGSRLVFERTALSGIANTSSYAHSAWAPWGNAGVRLRGPAAAHARQDVRAQMRACCAVHAAANRACMPRCACCDKHLSLHALLLARLLLLHLHATGGLPAVADHRPRAQRVTDAVKRQHHLRRPLNNRHVRAGEARRHACCTLCATCIHRWCAALCCLCTLALVRC